MVLVMILKQSTCLFALLFPFLSSWPAKSECGFRSMQHKIFLINIAGKVMVIFVHVETGGIMKKAL